MLQSLMYSIEFAAIHPNAIQKKSAHSHWLINKMAAKFNASVKKGGQTLVLWLIKLIN